MRRHVRSRLLHLGFRMRSVFQLRELLMGIFDDGASILSYSILDPFVDFLFLLQERF